MAPQELTDHKTLTSVGGAHGAYYTLGKLVNVAGISCSLCLETSVLWGEGYM